MWFTDAKIETSGGDVMATDKPRYSITVDEEMFKEIEDFRFEHRFPGSLTVEYQKKYSQVA